MALSPHGNTVRYASSVSLSLTLYISALDESNGGVANVLFPVLHEIVNSAVRLRYGACHPLDNYKQRDNGTSLFSQIMALFCPSLKMETIHWEFINS